VIDDTLTTGRARAAAPPPPVFVDTSGRRQRRVRRLGRLLAVPGAGYLALLASSMLGGPSLDAPFLPQSPNHAGPGARPSATATADPPSPVLPGTPVTTAVRNGTPTAVAGRPTPTAGVTSATLTPAPTPTPPRPSPTVTHGKSTAQPSRKPTKTP
jgi:hypothetical protein